jgi:glucan phosphoethanolaminetransferase (alkaline phosphatase superfamily)
MSEEIIKSSKIKKLLILIVLVGLSIVVLLAADNSYKAIIMKVFFPLISVLFSILVVKLWINEIKIGFSIKINDNGIYINAFPKPIYINWGIISYVSYRHKESSRTRTNQIELTIDIEKAKLQDEPSIRAIIKKFYNKETHIVYIDKMRSNIDLDQLYGKIIDSLKNRYHERLVEVDETDALIRM